MKAKFIYEKFTQDSDPIKDMGIGSHEFFKREAKRLLYSKYGGLKEEFNINNYDIDDEDYKLFICLVITSIIGSLGNKQTLPNSFQDAYRYWRDNFSNKKYPPVRYTIEKVRQILKDKYGLEWDAQKVYEKFTEYSDPIKDLNIGIDGMVKQMIAKFKQRNSGVIHSQATPVLSKKTGYENIFYVHIYANNLFWRTRIKEFFEEEPNFEFVNIKPINSNRWEDDSILFFKFNPNKKQVNEKFTQDSDPIGDLGIGMEHLIKKWAENETPYPHLHRNEDFLWISAKYGKEDFVKYLLDIGTDIHLSDDYAFRRASEEGHYEIVKMLLDAGADVHASNDDALQQASENGHDKVVKLLLDAGANVHAYNDKALRYAKNDKVVKLLLDAGADVHAKDDFALKIAIKKRRNKVIKILRDHIAKEKRIKESLNEKFTQSRLTR